MGVQINGSEGNVIATKGTYSGNVTIGGTLTYEDVTNIDSVGLVTARTGIEIGARPGVAASISVDGNAVLSGIVTVSTLQVSGTHADIADSIRHIGDSDTKIRFPDADTFTVETAGSERIRIKSNGNIGIGTDSPDDNDIHLKTGSATMKLTSTTAGNSSRLIIESEADSYGGVHFGDPSDEDAGRIRYYHGGSDPDHMQFSTSATERLRITSDGKLLIQEGTFAERTLGVSGKLQIEGTSAASSTISVVRNSNDINPSYLWFGKSRGTSVSANTILQNGDYIGTLAWYAADGNDLYSEAAFIRAGIATGRTQAIPTVGSNSTPGVLEFATALDGDQTPRKHVEIDSDGIFKMMTGNTESNGNNGFDKNQNPIGFYKITIADETNCSDILMPKPGCLILIQTYSAYPAYPQPFGSIAYVDSGASKRADVFLDPFSKLAAKTSLETTVSNCDDNKYTIMPGSAYQTFRITNRIDNGTYTFCITMI